MAGLSAIAVSACTLDLPPRPSETAGQRLALDCGELQPNLVVSCNDGDPPRTLLETEVTPLPVPPGGEPARAEVTLPCALGLDPGRRVLARTAAACTVSESAGTLHALLELEGYVERRCGTGVALSARHALVEQRRCHVLQRRGPGQQVERLEDKADGAAADAGEVVVGQLLDGRPAKAIGAAGGPVKTADDVHEG